MDKKLEMMTDLEIEKVSSDEVTVENFGGSRVITGGEQEVFSEISISSQSFKSDGVEVLITSEE